MNSRNREVNSLIVDDNFQLGQRMVVGPAEGVPGIGAPPPLDFIDGEIVPNVKNIFSLPVRANITF